MKIIKSYKMTCVTFYCMGTKKYYLDDKNNFKNIPSVISYYFKDFTIGQGITKCLSKRNNYSLVLSEKDILPNILNSLEYHTDKYVYISIIDSDYKILDEDVLVFPIQGTYCPFNITDMNYKNLNKLLLESIQNDLKYESKEYAKLFDCWDLDGLVDMYFSEDEKKLVLSYEDEEGNRCKTYVEDGVHVEFAKNLKIEVERSQEILEDIKNRLETIKNKNTYCDYNNYTGGKLELPSYPFLLKLSTYYDNVDKLEDNDAKLYEYLKDKRKLSLVTSRYIKKLPTYLIHQGNIKKMTDRDELFMKTNHVKNPYITMYTIDKDGIEYKNVYTFLSVV